MPPIDWQLAICFVVIAAATAVLLRRTVRAIRGEGEAGCTGCSKNCGTADEATTDPALTGFVPEDRITVRFEDESA